VRSLIAELGDAYCEELRRTTVGPFDVADAHPEQVLSLERALSFLPSVALDDEAARRAGHGQGVPGEAPDPAAEYVLLVDGDGPIAIAEPREDAVLKPIVGFRA
jgi:tRNA pseudouridine55 synthase